MRMDTTSMLISWAKSRYNIQLNEAQAIQIFLIMVEEIEALDIPSVDMAILEQGLRKFLQKNHRNIQEEPIAFFKEP